MKSLVLIDYISYLLGRKALRETKFHTKTLGQIFIRSNMSSRRSSCTILFSTAFRSIYLLDSLMVQMI